MPVLLRRWTPVADRLQIRGGPHRSDLMAWPDPRDPDDIEWSLTYGYSGIWDEGRRQLREAASYIAAYRALIDLPQKTRNARIEQIKRAMKEDPRGE